MRKVLVCVRSVAAAQNITGAAARLGLSAVVRTAVSEPEVMLRLSERPAEIVLADTALARPDSASFTRRVLARSPNSVIVLFGGEEPQVASAAIAAGARGLIRDADDLVSVVAKTLLLLAAPGRQTPALLAEQSATLTATVAPAPAETASVSAVAAASAANRATGTTPGADTGPAASAPTDAAATVVPNQRDDATAPASPTTGSPTAGGPAVTGGPSTATTPPGGTPTTGSAGTAPTIGPSGSPLRRTGLTERELQVLRGMSEGKSNGEIGRELFVSEDTVKTHARRLFRKLGARDRAHAVATGFRTGLVA
ncbi:response regulator transcription factor [Solwaraspora sp. WMMA2056]|uniref:response regulator transcription factor n=1 Tax=Solwaraspora sp. WMMA2056 TaxID=3015161 RepID=UPI00259BD2B1|nr:response regulator transcription factor [Solwaraspora sp. WMMA2056]WJK42360.1 response regulator transcription factor [Solwaraspora sp. WMMA2056]